LLCLLDMPITAQVLGSTVRAPENFRVYVVEVSCCCLYLYQKDGEKSQPYKVAFVALVRPCLPRKDVLLL
jgi:hypothetical protein